MRIRGWVLSAAFLIGVASCEEECEGEDTGGGGGTTCCKVCTDSKPCGDSCIARDKTCNIGPGCACSE